MSNKDTEIIEKKETFTEEQKQEVADKIREKSTELSVLIKDARALNLQVYIQQDYVGNLLATIRQTTDY